MMSWQLNLYICFVHTKQEYECFVFCINYNLHMDCSFLAHLFYKTEEVLSPPARRRRRLRLRQRPVKFWGKLLRQKIMSSFISSLAQNLFIFAVLIHMVVLINNQALINIQIYYFFHFFHIFGNVSTLKIFV